MAEKTNTTTNKDILSGKGLKPIQSPTVNIKQSGIATENRGQNTSGIRLDRFTKNTDKDGSK